MPNNSNDDRTLGKSVIIEPQHIIAASVMTQIWHRQNRLQHADLRKIRRMASFGDFCAVNLAICRIPSRGRGRVQLQSEHGLCAERVRPKAPLRRMDVPRPAQHE